MIWPEARATLQALCPPSGSCGLVSGIEILRGVRVNHTSPSPNHFLPHVFSYCCSGRPWSLFVGFFVILAILGPLLPFLFGRIMEIKTFVRVRARPRFFLHPLISEQNQRRAYREVLIAGDLSQDDVARATAQLGAFQVSQL